MIGKRIRFIRKKRNMTMKYLGMAVGLPENNADIRISQYESGTRTKSLTNLVFLPTHSPFPILIPYPA